MNELNNSSSALPQGFCAVSIDELDQIEGGSPQFDRLKAALVTRALVEGVLEGVRAAARFAGAAVNTVRPTGLPPGVPA